MSCNGPFLWKIKWLNCTVKCCWIRAIKSWFGFDTLRYTIQQEHLLTLKSKFEMVKSTSSFFSSFFSSLFSSFFSASFSYSDLQWWHNINCFRPQNEVLHIPSNRRTGTYIPTNGRQVFRSFTKTRWPILGPLAEYGPIMSSNRSSGDLYSSESQNGAQPMP